MRKLFVRDETSGIYHVVNGIEQYGRGKGYLYTFCGIEIYGDAGLRDKPVGRMCRNCIRCGAAWVLEQERKRNA